ncbi:Uncharacterised protein [Dermatophilus congolensis]|uniref:Uncharacterized protein n=1 Tax=Dermatophilus congolensis TaxID=1863 RepID=A0AA46BLP1_9MICO|nr:Uncharacterised protein [Dermatophilus congolensis]
MLIRGCEAACSVEVVACSFSFMGVFHEGVHFWLAQRPVFNTAVLASLAVRIGCNHMP